MNAQDAERLLVEAGFLLTRSKGNHRIYLKEKVRVVIPFHTGKTLHPKIVKQVIRAIDTDDQQNDNSADLQ